MRVFVSEYPDTGIANIFTSEILHRYIKDYVEICKILLNHYPYCSDIVMRLPRYIKDITEILPRYCSYTGHAFILLIYEKKYCWDITHYYCQYILKMLLRYCQDIVLTLEIYWYITDMRCWWYISEILQKFWWDITKIYSYYGDMV